MPEYEYQDHSIGYKLLIAFITLLLFGLALVLIGFAWKFFYTYETYLNYVFAVLFSGGGLAGLAYFWFEIKLKFERKRLENKHYEQQLLLVTSNNELFNATVRQLDSGQVYLAEQRTEQGALIKFNHLPKSAQKQSSPSGENALSLSVALPEIKNSLLSDLEHCQRMLISGGSGTGKTSLLLHIAQQRDQLGDLVILDLDGKTNKWGKYKAHGAGDNTNEIIAELDKLKTVFTERAGQYSSGIVEERGFDLITIIADEWHEMSAEIPDLSQRIKKILTRGRKYSMDLIIGTNGLTADSLGLHGKMDLIHNFEARVRLDKVESRRLAYVTFGKSKQEVVYEHCGAFIQAKNYQIVMPEIKTNVDFTNKINQILNEELAFETRVIDLYNEMKSDPKYSLTKLTKKVYEGRDINGRDTKIVAEILSRHGCHDV